MNHFAENIPANNNVIIQETSTVSQPKVQRSTSQTHFTKCDLPEIVVQQSNQIGSGPKRSSSGLLSIFKWFKKNSDNRGNSFYSSASSSTSASSSNSSLNNDESTITYPLSRNQSAASVDSLFSTATVASFTYISPAVYNPLGNAETPEKLIAPGPETNTHKKRMKQLEKVRERDKNITLRKKYKLFSCETVKNKNNTNSNSKKKKDKSSKNCVATITNNRDYCELSLPLIKCQNKNSMDKGEKSGSAPIKSHHRRTVSDSSKDKKAGAYCHVKGKRKAPQPPNTTETLKHEETNTLTRKMKRQAPQPPAEINDNEKNSNLTQQQKEFLITNIAKLQSSQSNSLEIMTSQNGINEMLNKTVAPDIVCNDSLKLESGILKPVKETLTPLKSVDNKIEKKSTTQASPISPKPWYKRTLSSNRDSSSSSSGSAHFKKELYKHHSKSEDNDESKYSKENSKLSSVLSRFSMSSDERKKDENRKSAISMLANISELDREAALIVQKEQSKVQAEIDAQNEAYYSPSSSQNDVPSFLMGQQQPSKNTCKKGSARELISKFNALTSATRISVNSALFSSSKEDNRNARRFSYNQSSPEKDNLNEIKNKYSPFSVVTPPMKRSIFKLEEFSEKEEDLPVPMWKSNESNFEPKVVNAPSNIMKYFDSPKPEKIDNKIIEEQPKNNLEKDVKKDGWTCMRCTLENGRMDLKCVVCGMWKPFGKSADKYFGPTSAQKDIKNNEKEPKQNNEKNQNLENETKMARTFAENVFKAFEMNDEDKKLDEIKPNKETAKEIAIVSSVTVVEPELSLEELRKARLARFSQNLDEQENTIELTEEDEKQNEQQVSKAENSETNLSTSNKLLSDEQKKLRKMLKEMRDSLPKTGSTLTTSRKSTLEKEEPIKEDVELRIVEENDQKIEIKTKDEHAKEKDVSKGAIPKIFKQKPVIVDEILKNKEENVITAYVITKETTYENIKVKKENVDLDKPVKVSASSQTQSVKITAKPPLGRDNIMLPLSVEEMSTPKSTISRVGSFGKGQFELIRAKDFVGISSNVTTPDSPLYANLPVTIEPLEITTPQKTSPSNSSSQQSISSSEEELLSVQLSDPEGIKDFKATLKQDKHNANTLAINRLLRRLETAIASGQHIQAARLAKDLARWKVNCSVTRQKKLDSPNTKYITADMYVEDQVTHQGPIPLRINPEMTIADLKQKVAQEFEIPSHVQRWILDRQLATDDEITLEELNINFDGCPMFLYLVAPDGEYDETLKRASKRVRDGIKNITQPIEDVEQSDSDITEEEEIENNINEATNIIIDRIEKNLTPINMWKCPICTLLNDLDRPGCEACSTERPRSVEPKQKNYLQLMDLDNTDLVSNTELFECLICFTECQIGEGVILRECLHTFCKQCLAHTIEYTEEVEIKCPYRDSDYSCDLVLQEREIKALVTKEVYEHHLALSVKQAENKIDNAFHCKTPDCRGWCIFEDNVNEFNCPVCKANNCLTCQVIHEGLNCKQYQEQLNQNSESNVEARRTKEFLDEMVSRGEAMVCPTCQVVLMKKWGCDWLRCSMCKTEICWVTRGPRWGPTGKGDTTGGCKCGVNGIKCHPKCTYCH